MRKKPRILPLRKCYARKYEQVNEKKTTAKELGSKEISWDIATKTAASKESISSSYIRTKAEEEMQALPVLKVSDRLLIARKINPCLTFVPGRVLGCGERDFPTPFSMLGRHWA